MNQSKEQSAWLSSVFEKLLTKMEAQCLRIGSSIPFIPYQGSYRDCMMPDGLSWWTNGFWPGMLWQMYHVTQKECYRDAAIQAGERLNETLTTFDKLHHDVGFMFMPSAVAQYRSTGDESARCNALHAATLLAGRFNPTGEYIKAWDKSAWQEDVTGWMIIDSLLNLPLLYWASEQTKDPRFADIANRHAHTALHSLLREDDSCNHIAEFNSSTGEFLKGVGGQGFGEGSSWSRGQSWAVYGYALAFRYTKNMDYLNAAKRCAHYCIANLAISDWLPLVDFRAPQEPVKYDSGAGVIIACGLLEIAEHVPALEQPLYKEAAQHILYACEQHFADWNPQTDGILFGGTTMYHDDRLANTSIIYGDYFFLEGILRLEGKQVTMW
ncbi:MAG: glycoside hydrolase family 88 protein [Sphaerochaetaceae bacterium]